MFKDVDELTKEEAPEKIIINVKAIVDKNIIFDDYEEFNKGLYGVVYRTRDGTEYAIGEKFNYIYEPEEKNGLNNFYEERTNNFYIG